MPELTAPAEIDLVQLPDRQARLGRGGAAPRRVAVAIACAMKLLMSFSTMPWPGGTGVDDVLAERGEHRLQFRERRVVGADHDVELAQLRLDRRARERRVDEAHALRGERLAHLRGRRRLARRRVDDDEPLARHAGDAVLAVDDLLDLRRAGHAQEHDVGVARDVGVGLHFLGARREQVLERLAVAVDAHRQRKALGDEVLRDAVAHEADADESDARLVHVLPPC